MANNQDQEMNGEDFTRDGDDDAQMNGDQQQNDQNGHSDNSGRDDDR